MLRRRLMSLVIVALAAVAGSHPVLADVPRGVIGAFRGQLVVSQDDLPDTKNDKATIAGIKAGQLKEVGGTSSQNVTYWRFHYTAFLTKTGSATLTLKFLDGDRMAAHQRLDGVNPNGAVLTGYISINEDDGLVRGTTYTLELVDGKNGVVAKTTLKMK